MNWRPDRDHQRTILVTWPYFSRNRRGRRVFQPGTRPPRPAPQPITLRHPIQLADDCASRLDADSKATQQQVAANLGVSAVRVSQHLALVRRLPPSFVDWYRGTHDAGVLKALTERRLRPVTRLRGRARQSEHLAGLLEEAGIPLSEVKEIVAWK